MKQRVIIKGRPDFGTRGFGQTEAKKYPKYVYSRTGNAGLIHKVASVKFLWWEGCMDIMIRRDKPTIIAETLCGMSKYMDGEKAAGCELPAQDSVLCAKCHGLGHSNFGKHGITKLSRKQAAKLLACAKEM